MSVQVTPASSERYTPSVVAAYTLLELVGSIRISHTPFKPEYEKSSDFVQLVPPFMDLRIPIPYEPLNVRIYPALVTFAPPAPPLPLSYTSPVPIYITFGLLASIAIAPTPNTPD